MNKFLSVLMAGLFAASISAGAIAAEAAPVAAAAKATKATDAKVPSKVELKAHAKQVNHKAK